MNEKQFVEKLGSYLISKIAIANKNYDKGEQVQRFYIGVGVGIAPFLVMKLASIWVGGVLEFIGFMWIFSMIGMRLWWLHGNLNNWLPANKEDAFVDMTKTSTKD